MEYMALWLFIAVFILLLTGLYRKSLTTPMILNSGSPSGAPVLRRRVLPTAESSLIMLAKVWLTMTFLPPFPLSSSLKKRPSAISIPKTSR